MGRNIKKLEISQQPLSSRSKPKNYIVGVRFYSSTIPKTLIRTRFLNKDLVQNMVNVLSTHVSNTVSKIPDIPDHDVLKEVKTFFNKMENEELEWITSHDSHDNRAATLMVPISGRNKGVFLSFNV